MAPDGHLKTPPGLRRKARNTHKFARKWHTPATYPSASCPAVVRGADDRKPASVKLARRSAAESFAAQTKKSILIKILTLYVYVYIYIYIYI